MIRRSFAVFVAVLSLSAAHCCEAEEDPDGRLRAIREHWRQRQAEFPCVSYAWKATTTWSRGAFAETADELKSAPNPPSDVSSTSRRSLLLDFANNRHSAMWDDHDYSNLKGVHYRLHCNNVCDGTTVYSRIFENDDPGLRPNQARKHVDLLIQTGQLPAGVFTRGDFLTVLLAHGAVWYGDHGPRPGKLTPTNEFSGLIYDREEEFDGRKCSVLRTGLASTTRTELWVDPALGDVVVKLVVLNDQPWLVYELGYARVNDALVLARWSRWQFDIADGRLVFQEDCEATAIETAPKLTDVPFVYTPQPGMAVEAQEYSTTESGRYTSKSRFYQLEDAGQEIELDGTTLQPKVR